MLYLFRFPNEGNRDLSAARLPITIKMRATSNVILSAAPVNANLTNRAVMIRRTCASSRIKRDVVILGVGGWWKPGTRQA
jgi:hypothetical protein